MFDHSKDDFWDLSEYAKKPVRNKAIENSFSQKRTSAVEVTDNVSGDTKRADISETLITKFIPPHTDSIFEKKHILFSYEPENPLIKSVTVFSDKEKSRTLSRFCSENIMLLFCLFLLSDKVRKADQHT